MFGSKIAQLGAIVMVIGVWAGQIFASEGAAVFLNQAISPVARSLGRAYSASATGVDAVFWNPAALSGTHGSQVSLSTYRAFEADFLHAGYSKSFGSWGLGIYYGGASFGDVKETSSVTRQGDSRYQWTGNTLGYAGKALLIAAGIELHPSASVGVALKGIQETLATADAAGFGGDIGAKLNLIEPVTLAVVMQNILQPRMAWNTPSQNIDLVSRVLAVGVQTQVLSNLALNVEFTQSQERQALQAGVQWWAHPQLAIRAGIAPSFWAIGSSLKIENCSVDFAFNQNVNTFIEAQYSLGIKCDF
jgi:hypothetical protein